MAGISNVARLATPTAPAAERTSPVIFTELCQAFRFDVKESTTSWSRRAWRCTASAGSSRRQT
eukprot:5445624-Heterocapsa_arctica.AAC.1